MSIKLLDLQAMFNRPKPRMLVDNLLVEGTLTALVSKPGLGKSFIALDLAMTIASGKPSFVGFGVRRSGPVVFIVAEGSGRFGLRIKAWQQFNQVTGKKLPPFHWVDGPVDLLDTDRVDEFIAHIEDIQPVLVVVDTLSRCIVGSDENSQEAMSSAVDSADRIKRSVPNMTVLLLHHLNAAGSRERGSSVLGGALDSMLYLKPRKNAAKGKAVLTAEKQKDIDMMDPLNVKARIVAIDDEREENGELSTSLVWVLDSTVAPVVEQPPDLQSRVLREIENWPGITPSRVEKAIEARNADVRAAVKELIDTGAVRKEPGVRGGSKLYIAAPVAAEQDENDEAALPVDRATARAGTLPRWIHINGM